MVTSSNLVFLDSFDMYIFMNLFFKKKFFETILFNDLIVLNSIFSSTLSKKNLTKRSVYSHFLIAKIYRHSIFCGKAIAFFVCDHQAIISCARFAKKFFVGQFVQNSCSLWIGSFDAAFSKQNKDSYVASQNVDFFFDVYFWSFTNLNYLDVSEKHTVGGVLSNWSMLSFNFARTLDFMLFLRRGVVFQRMKYVCFTKIFKFSNSKFVARFNFKFNKPSAVFIFDCSSSYVFLKEAARQNIPTVFFTNIPPVLATERGCSATYSLFLGNFSATALHVFFSYFFFKW